ncbi:MAG: DUF4157 domain-containing protein [Leptonema illini]|uniref:DUF4157 domain-containing protein n=1 Tax=Leptonema illini TaxID=183 RepID=A0A833GXW0_9LEPT|nr:MAG: DUF4157 domain-containing protein [Leptonema illini]
MDVNPGIHQSEAVAGLWQTYFYNGPPNAAIMGHNPYYRPPASEEHVQTGSTVAPNAPTAPSTISRAPAVQASTAEEGFPLNEAQAEKVDTALAETGQPLPEPEKAVYEAHTGHDFSRVRVHTGAAAEEAADSIGAKAFAKGSDIVFAKGEYNPNTAEGRGLIGHELAHVAQNATGVHRAPKEGEKEKSWYERLSDKVEDAGAAAVEYTLDGLIKIVENIPIVLFGPFPFIADLFRSGVVGFLKRTAKEGGRKILGLLGNFVQAVTSASFVKAYIIGMARGFFVDGLWGTLTLLWDIATLPVKLYDFGKHVFQVLGEVDLGAGMQKIGSLMLDAGKYLSGNGKSLIEKLVENAKASKVDDVADTFSNLYGTAKEKATELGGSVADIFVKFFSQKPEKVGETLGDAAGSLTGGLAFDALLGVVTAGAAAAAKRGLTAARRFVQPLLNLLIRTGQKAVSAVQNVWGYAKRITASARTGILTWVKKVSAELGAKAHAVVEGIENFVEILLKKVGFRRFDLSEVKVLTLKEAKRLPKPNKGLIFVEENSAKLDDALRFEDGATGAFYTRTEKRVVPALRYDHPNPNGNLTNNFVRFDGIEPDGITLIDRKLSLTTKSDQIDAIKRASSAIKQNKGYKLVYEFPDQKTANRAREILIENNISNIKVRP